ncbi:hypothetical protein CEXT_696701 [Caerostris extrusa]|uniref:Uncharacterized protein n=1 Tax=Caerostris extrusa TaxID=172846 RepID=A0AAV4Y896_CAEEX|nr:hypothetical protein CEXT_696701 [Caerostris extrusa]
MASMSEERRKEMEEEMSRFELEIAAPSKPKSSGNKPLSPPPPPPAVAVLLPEVLGPPPPPALSPPVGTTLQAPPRLPVLHAQPATPAMRFIPHQLQRQPPRPPMRSNFMGMRGPPAPFPPPGSFGPHMGQGPPMPQVGPMPPRGPMHPGGPMLPMPPGAIPMQPMPHQMGAMNMGVNLPVPPGFCPPGPPIGSSTNMMYESQTHTSSASNTETEPSMTTSTAKSSESSVVASAPTIYAAPFMKSSENAAEGLTSGNGQETQVTSAASSVAPKLEKVSVTKVSRETSAVPTASGITEETVVSKKKEKKKKDYPHGWWASVGR